MEKRRARLIGQLEPYAMKVHQLQGWPFTVHGRKGNKSPFAVHRRKSNSNLFCRHRRRSNRGPFLGPWWREQRGIFQGHSQKNSKSKNLLVLLQAEHEILPSLLELPSSLFIFLGWISGSVTDSMCLDFLVRVLSPIAEYDDVECFPPSPHGLG